MADAVKKVVKARFFDIEKFEKRTVEKEIEVRPDVTSVKEALEAVGNDQAKLVSLCNVALKRMQLLEVKKQLQEANGGVDTGTISKFVAAFRLMPKFAKMNPSNDPGDKRKAQTKAIYDYIKANPMLLEDLKQSALEAEDEDDSDSEEEESGE